MDIKDLFYEYEILDTFCSRISDEIDDIRNHYLEWAGSSLSKITKDELEAATVDMAGAVLKLRRAEGIFRKYKI